MVQYNFKKITVVPEAKDFINIALSRTQRKTPTVVHPQFQIQRIRRFYMRKVKFTQVTIHDKFSLILEEFPRLEDIHPFYADLMNVLYDKDHYKLALGQINTARNLIDGVGRDYVRLLKYGDSLYRCKQLKRAALGRMVTILKKQAGSLAYLENVRQHLARLPTIDPTTRTLILCGYPNVGKSSFMNKVTRANVEVQPYAFTTKSLFVGHAEYKYLKWQVIDTPGILDHPLEERNTIEMQSITALAHLRACVLFLIDMSEHCGYSIKQQVDLFNSIKPLFTGKPLLIVLTKTDLIRYENLSKENRELLESIAKSANVEMMGMSNITDEGISEVKQKACDVLLQHRVESKLGKTGKTLENILNRIHLAQPVKRDEKKRETTIPQTVLERQKMEEDGMEVEPRKTERDLEQENGGAGVYDADLKKGYNLKNQEWKYDIIPEIMDGKNIADYVDPEVLKMLDQLEKEEDALIDNGDDDIDYGAEDVFVSQADEDMHEKIQSKKAISTQEKKLNNKKSKIPKKYKPVDVDKIAEELMSRGVDKEVIERARSRSRALSKVRTPSKTSSRARSLSEQRGIAEAEAKEESKLLGKRKRTLTPSNRSLSASDKYSGIRNPNEQYRAIWTGRKKQRVFTQDARPSESDRLVFDLMPKHLFSGKRGNGKTERR